MCSGWVSSTCSTCDTRRVTLITNAMIGREYEKGGIVNVTNETNPW
jgi:hypothetical protein